MKELQEQLALLGGDEIANPNMSAPTSQGGSTASWYFYNQTSVTRGATEFRNKWGNRTLEDFWFIKNKKSMMTEEEAAGKCGVGIAQIRAWYYCEMLKGTQIGNSLYFLKDVADPRTTNKIETR